MGRLYLHPTWVDWFNPSKVQAYAQRMTDHDGRARVVLLQRNGLHKVVLKDEIRKKMKNSDKVIAQIGGKK